MGSGAPPEAIFFIFIGGIVLLGVGIYLVGSVAKLNSIDDTLRRIEATLRKASDGVK